MTRAQGELESTGGEQQAALEKPKTGAEPSRDVRSLKGQVATEVTFTNRMTEPILIYWVDYQGKEVFYRELQPGESYGQQTYVTHPWRVRDKKTHRLIKTVVAEPTRQVVIINQEELRGTGGEQQAALEKPTVGTGQRPAARGISQEEARIKLEQMGIPYSEEAFINSAAKGNTSVVEMFLAAGMNPNVKDNRGNTPLMFTAQGGHTDIVKVLLANGANVDPPIKKGFFGYRPTDHLTALMLAAQEGHADIVKILLANGAEVNAQYKGDTSLTALILAAANGRTPVVRILLAKGADVIAGEERQTALFAAVNNGHIEIVQLLKQAGAWR